MKLELTEEQATRILNLLATHPYSQVADLVNLIQSQAQEQLSNKLVDDNHK